MKRNVQIKFFALALAVLGLFQLSLIWDGRLVDYVDPRQGMLVFLTGLGCVILAQVVLSTAGTRVSRSVENEDSEENPDSGSDRAASGLIWLVVPLLVFLLFR
ncbi:MAG: hypothetical protein D9V45_08365 [Chloroflexi bacterium]|nr:hypothetical protein [Anaerolinea sp.]TDA64633.1 MAG: hypothetical protein D9V45_08365 [Chloroflexota bacterium]